MLPISGEQRGKGGGEYAMVKCLQLAYAREAFFTSKFVCSRLCLLWAVPLYCRADYVQYLDLVTEEGEACDLHMYRS